MRRDGAPGFGKFYEELKSLSKKLFSKFYDNVLDLCFSNCECNLSLVLEEFINPDIAHPVFDMCTILSRCLNEHDIFSAMSYDCYKLDFKSANYNDINSKFYLILLTIIDNEVPKKHYKLSTVPN